MAQQILTQEYLQELLYYSVVSGKFYWKVNKCYRALVNSRAGHVCKTHGYRGIKINGIGYKEHFLAFLYIDGIAPKEVDHKNRIKINNGWHNISEISHQGNMLNKSFNSANKSGFNGVLWHKATNKWIAQISFKNKKIHLGVFDNKKEAIQIRKEANIKYGFSKTHGEIINEC